MTVRMCVCGGGIKAPIRGKQCVYNKSSWESMSSEINTIMRLVSDQYSIDLNANKGLKLWWTTQQTCSGHVRQAAQLARTTLTKFLSICD